ncbi:MAG TPA: PLP-dependent aminotransferase family protein [Solirubrobacterales bacterium]|nr:PLP-dependent aminotransferase family protein [Solirubrobacterales bacterium]
MDQSEFTNRLLGGLGAWTEGKGPLYRRLAAALRRSIDQGLIPPGTRLPAERALADLIHVSRGTVVAAYGLLEEEGLVDRRQGSGTVVRAPAVPRPDDVVPKAALLSALVAGPEPPIDLSLAAPPSTELPLDHTISLQDIAAVSSLLGYAPMGLPAMRTAIAERFTAEGFETSPEEVLITTGAQQGIALIAALELGAGDFVALESPTYPGVIEAFARAGARLLPLDLDHGGARADSLRRALERHPVRLLHITPTCQNPTGRVMSERRRGELLALAREHDVSVIEDTVMENLAFGMKPPPRLAELTGGDHNLYTVGSFSKTLWGGLRVGWVRASASAVLRLGRLKVAQDLGTPAPTQALALSLLPLLDETIDRRQEALRERMGVLTAELTRELPEWEWAKPQGGYALWVKLPRGASGDEFAQLALRHGVAVSPGSSFSPAEEHLDHIRVCFGLDPDTLRRAVPKLAEAWREMETGAVAGRAARVVAV